MSIDLATEHTISVHEACRLIPPYRRNKPTHHSRVIRLILSGDLEALRVGSQWITSREAVQRMGERLAERELSGTSRLSPAPLAGRTSAARARAIAQADAELQRLGV